MYKRGYTCRCSRCGARKTLSMRPEHYRRGIPKCHYASCAAKGGRMRVDWYRMKVERAAKPCACSGYGFLHRHGSGFCVHNPKPKTELEHAQREGYKSVASWRAAIRETIRKADKAQRENRIDPSTWRAA